LLALNAYLKLDLGKGQLEAVAARLGSDLSFFFHEPSALCRGRGELVEPIAPPLPRWGLLVMPGIHMPTPAVYRRFDELGLGDDDVEREPIDPNQWCTANSLQLLARLRNDLEPPAFSLDPKLGDLRKEIEQLLARTVRMSGSGSSLFTLFDHEPDAQQAASTVSSRLHIRAIPVELAPKIRDDLHEDPTTRY
jgi:4-diphosphocytidyl-2-C-methyl-D-erythritol kinase